MMFASDLDRTLIYSNRALADFKHTDLPNLTSVECKNNEEVAFMTRKAKELLKAIANNCLFVPVTTRTYEQFKRIFMFSKDIPITYSVTSNGANIFYEGQQVVEWQQLVQNRLKKECASIEEMMTQVKKMKIKGTLKIAEQLFFYFILENGISLETINKIKLLASQHGWRVSIQGRKLYVVPKPVCKGEAIKFIKEKHRIQTLLGAGDSILDYDFLKICDFSYVPSHGELGKEIEFGDCFNFSQKKGVLAGEEILDEIAKKLGIYVNIS